MYLLIDMPLFMCKVCGRKLETEYITCDCNHSHGCDHKRTPECCNQPMIEAMDD